MPESSFTKPVTAIKQPNDDYVRVNSIEKSGLLYVLMTDSWWDLNNRTLWSRLSVLGVLFGTAKCNFLYVCSCYTCSVSNVQ